MIILECNAKQAPYSCFSDEHNQRSAITTATLPQALQLNPLCMDHELIITSLPKVIWEEGRVAASVPRDGLTTTAKVVAGEFITPH